jgi:hypothetical protein
MAPASYGSARVIPYGYRCLGSLDGDREEARQERGGGRAAEAAKSQAAQDLLSTRGLFAFAEPLKPGEVDALTRYVNGHPDMPTGDLLRLSEQYQDPGLMHELVRLRFCPPEALQIIFTKTVKNNEMPMSGPTHWAVEDTFFQIAHRADTPPEVLGKLLNVAESPEVRLAALKNLRGHPKPANEGHLKTGQRE